MHRGNNGKQKKAVDEYVAIHKLFSPLETKAMRTKNPQAFRLSDRAVEALENEAARTGKSKTGVIEDLLLWQRLFSEEAEAAMNYMAKKHQLPARKVAHDMGNSPRILLTHYRELVRKEEAQAFWELRPQVS